MVKEKGWRLIFYLDTFYFEVFRINFTIKVVDKRDQFYPTFYRKLICLCHHLFPSLSSHSQVPTTNLQKNLNKDYAWCKYGL